MLEHVLRPLLAEWREQNWGIRIGVGWPSILAFADDVYSFARTQVQVQTKLVQLSAYLRAQA